MLGARLPFLSCDTAVVVSFNGILLSLAETIGNLLEL